MSKTGQTESKLPLVPMLGSLALAVLCAFLLWWLFIREASPEDRSLPPALPIEFAEYPTDLSLVGEPYNDEEFNVEYRPPAGQVPLPEAELEEARGDNETTLKTRAGWGNTDAGTITFLRIVTPPEQVATAEGMARSFATMFRREPDPQAPPGTPPPNQDHIHVSRIMLGGQHMLYKLTIDHGEFPSIHFFGELGGGKIVQLDFFMKSHPNDELAQQIVASVGTLSFVRSD